VSGSRSRYQILVICGLLLLAVGLVFGQTVRHEFVNFDDPEYVCENPQVSAGLTAHGVTWAFTQSHGANWIPVTWVSLMLDCQLYGLNAGGYHLTNVLLHAVTVVLLFLVLQWMTGCLWPSALVAVLFAVHPLRVESVAWVTERKDVLSGLFFMLTLGAYVGYARHRFSLGRYLAVMVFFALGLMAKATLVTLPLVLLLLDYWPLGRTTPAATRDTPVPSGGRGDRFALLMRLLLEKVPLLALVAVSCVVTVWAQREALVPIEQLPLWWRMGNALVSYVTYLGQFFYPVGLAVLYPRPSLDLPFWKVFGASLVLVSITAVALLWRRRCPCLLAGWLWYLGMLLPVIGLVQFGVQAVADRFSYLPQIGLCIALVWAVAEACRSWPYRRWLYGVTSALVLAGFMGCAWRQTSFWRDSETLWTHALACTLRNFTAHDNLGLALAHCGQVDQAIAHYQKALEIKPDYALAHNNLGVVLARRGQVDEAIVQFQRAVEIKPNDMKAHNNLAMALTARGRLKEAMRHYRKVLEIKPDYADAHNDLAWLLATCPVAALRNGAEAVHHARQANQLSDSKRPGILDTLSAAYAEAGRFPEALAAARKALELAVQQNNRPLVDALRAHIALYEAGRPYHQTPAASTPPPKP
jgi:Flp pilus assembly protein TadD